MLQAHMLLLSRSGRRQSLYIWLVGSQLTGHVYGLHGQLLLMLRTILRVTTRTRTILTLITRIILSVLARTSSLTLIARTI